MDSFSCFKAKSVDLSVNTIFGISFPDKNVGIGAHGAKNAQVSKSSKMVLNRVRGDVSGSRPLPSFSEHMSDDGDYGNSGPNS